MAVDAPAFIMWAALSLGVIVVISLLYAKVTKTQAKRKDENKDETVAR